MAKNIHISIGRLGEDIAVAYLLRRGYSIVCRNYRKKWGEIDIVADKDNVRHIVEVKAASCVGVWPVDGREGYRPEDHMHTQKLARMGRALQTYFIEYPLLDGQEWTVDLIVVYLNVVTRRARIKVLWNILLE